MKPKRMILCVDDNEQSLSIRKLLLTTHGYRVISCSNAQEAIGHFQKGGIDLLLTDLIMPGGPDGAELIDKVKQMSPETPAILFSGEIRNFERETRADLFLPKGSHPPAELLERIRLLLVRKRGPKRNSTSGARPQMAV
jgi:two-component system response regulator CpxR